MTIDNDADEAVALDAFKDLNVTLSGLPGWMADDIGLQAVIDKLDDALTAYADTKGDLD